MSLYERNEVVEERFIQHRMPFLVGDFFTEHDDVHDNLLVYIESGVYGSEKDKEIALRIAETLHANSGKRGNQYLYVDAANALANLIPLEEEDGGGIDIANTSLKPGIERRIASRLSSESVDVTSGTGSWGSLPRSVRQELFMPGDSLIMEMTDSCTVGCGFCVIAEDKGPITQKMSFDSVTRLMQEYRDSTSDAQPRTVIPYCGSDPFDVRWNTTDGAGQDFTDVATAFDEVFAEVPLVRMFTSTAVPIGEEMRILDYAARFLQTAKDKGPERHELRISVTSANWVRASAVIAILRVLGCKYTKNLPIDDSISRRGKMVREDGVLSPWDIIGPDCYDSVVVGVHSVDAMYLEAASNTNPNGSRRVPIATTETDDAGQAWTTYRWPKQYFVPMRQFKHDPRLEYPMTPVRVRRFPVLADGSEELPFVEDETRFGPHRALARLVYAADYMETHAMTEIDRERIVRCLLPAARVVKLFLERDGQPDDVTMRAQLATTLPLAGEPSWESYIE